LKITVTVREGIDHSALWLEDDGYDSGWILYDPAGQEYFPADSNGMRYSDVFTGKFADPAKYIANFPVMLMWLTLIFL
jgi:hypothetical protein